MIRTFGYVPPSGSISAADIAFVATTDIVSINVQAAIEEVRANTDFDDIITITNSVEGNVAGMNTQSVRELHTLAAATTSDTTIDIPSGAILLGASFNVDTAVTTSAASNTWDADFVGGSATALVAAGAAGAQNTKGNKLVVPELAAAQTNIQFAAPGAETFTAGVIEVIAYYMDLTGLADA